MAQEMKRLYRVTDPIIHRNMRPSDWGNQSMVLPKSEAQKYVLCLEKVYEERGTFSHEEMMSMTMNSPTMRKADREGFVSGATYPIDKGGLELFRTALDEIKRKVGL